jgi:hypothetical protein
VEGREVVNTIGLVHTETIEGTRPCLLVAIHSAVLGDGYAGSASGKVGEVCKLGCQGSVLSNGQKRAHTIMQRFPQKPGASEFARTKRGPTSLKKLGRMATRRRRAGDRPTGGPTATTKFTGKVIAEGGLRIRDWEGKVMTRVNLNGKVILS